MKKNTTFLFLLLSVCLLSNKSFATHFLGGEIGYTCIAPGTYVAEYKAYFDCNASGGPPQTWQLNLKSAGCVPDQVITASKGSTDKVIQTYCPSYGNTCGVPSLYKLLETTYTATFTVAAQCTEYYLSVQDCSIGPMVNLDGFPCLYLETYLNTAAPGNNISSPAFLGLTTLHYTVNSPVTIPNMAIDRYPGGLDSLGYALTSALENANTPITYTNGTSFSNPILSSAPITFHPASGLLSFTPNVFNNVPPIFSNNVYAMVVEASGYKKINGVMTKVTSAQRRYPVAILDTAPNQNPEITNITINGQPLPVSGIVDAFSGDNLTIQFATADANTADTVSIYDPGSNLPVPTTTGGKNPTGTLNLNLTNEGLHWYPIIVKDNACPVRGVATQMVGLNMQKALGIAKDVSANTGFTAFPNPFSNAINFRISQPATARVIAIFNLLGQQIDAIPLKTVGSGEQKVQWQNANKYAAGTYVARLISEDKTIQTLKFTKLQ
ncbi:T9SS type A sorting domain-containing protein [Adhaeribacter terreus]|uniref:T9SS type A sorting domain-containing protein n=1 Tax=Adhaeribacter terreus TaxID=529703 RepID=A0ABW0EF76_9BACT